MQIISIHDAKTHLARLLGQAVKKGEPFIIAKAGKPIAKVIPFLVPDVTEVKRLGFMKSQITVPDDFDQIGKAEVAQLFSQGL